MPKNMLFQSFFFGGGGGGKMWVFVSSNISIPALMILEPGFRCGREGRFFFGKTFVSAVLKDPDMS